MERRVIGTRIRRSRPLSRPEDLNLRQYYDKRNEILFLREVGGLGDILMHRMMFEDFKAICPDFKIVFACPKVYHDAVRDHPFIDKILDSNEVDPYEYLVYFNTSAPCGRYEMKIAPLSDLHRSDIWSQHCGVNLTNHDMHIRMSDEEKAIGRKTISSLPGYRGQPTVAICPISAMAGKNLDLNQIAGVVEGVRRRGLLPFAVHKTPILDVIKSRCDMVSGLGLREWMGVMHEADYVISVDTSSFHCRGGMNKPQVGVFSFANGDTYGKYYTKLEIVQGPCPIGHKGCYNWSICPKISSGPCFPCGKDLESSQILLALDRLLSRFPVPENAMNQN